MRDIAARKLANAAESPSFESGRRHGTSNLDARRDGIRILRTILAEWVRPR